MGEEACVPPSVFCLLIALLGLLCVSLRNAGVKSPIEPLLDELGVWWGMPCTASVAAYRHKPRTENGFVVVVDLGFRVLGVTGLKGFNGSERRNITWESIAFLAGLCRCWLGPLEGCFVKMSDTSSAAS